MKRGQQFEADFRKSVSNDVWFYRFKDGTANWNRSDDNIRFQAQNICDCQIYRYPNLFLIELKTTQQKSFSFSSVRENQLKQLLDANRHHGIIAGIVVNFSTIDETYFMSISHFDHCKNTLDRASIPLFEFQEYCIRIEQHQLRVNFRYDISEFLKIASITSANGDIFGRIRKSDSTDADSTATIQSHRQAEIF